MNTLRDRVLQLLTDSEKPLTLPKISKALGLTMPQNGEVQRELTLLHRERRVRVDRDGGWAVMAAAPDAAADELSAEEGTAQAADPAGEPAVNRRRENLARQRSANTTVARARNRELRERMLERFSLGEQTFDQLRAAFPEAGWHRIKNAVTKLLGAGHLERARYGVYRLASRDAATTVAPADGTPHADVRDRLLRGADLVLEGKLSKDGAEALVELVDAILAIDLGAPT